MSDFYPKFKNKEDHLLFDYGFMSALLMRSGMVLMQALEVITDQKLRAEIEDILSSMESYHKGRLQFRDEIYAAGAAAAAKISREDSPTHP